MDARTRRFAYLFLAANSAEIAKSVRGKAAFREGGENCDSAVFMMRRRNDKDKNVTSSFVSR